MNPLPQILQQAFKEKEVFTAAGKKTAMHSNVSVEECAALHAAVRAIRPAVSAEVGFAQGISALAILQGLADNGAGMHHVIDPFQARFENCGLAMVERAGLGGRMQFYEKFAEEVIPSLPRLQFVFIDASHLFDLTLCEFVLADKKLDVGGVIGFHDLWMPSLQKLVRYILSNRAYEVYGAKGGGVEAGGGFIAKAARGIAKRVAGKRRVFSREFLEPWGSLGLQNMVLLRKTTEDAREWDFHAKF